MQLGDLELHLLVTDHWKADGGLMFGVVPKIMWEKKKPPDGNNMIDCACVCLIARKNGRVIICETGIGSKLSEKRALQVALREPEGMLHALRRLGIRPEEVDAVVTTHLHWDHAGGLTRRDEYGELELTFKNARHFIQRSEWDFALRPDVRSKPSYITDDFTPLADGNDLVEFLDGDAEVLPGVQIRHVGGHTPGSQVLILRSGELACAVTGDLVCQTPHLRVPWNMAADIEPLRVFEQKARLLDEAEKHRWLVVLSHETDQPAGYLEDGGRWRPEPRLA
ncbi:MAG: MBL fold metallo-hydrolase [Chloroflexi bacterium]|nr:MAG: MBL fold metallo-hydrolase [Chloroflexota bacterium]TMG07439.1 MAG: MBL fold metallo-hydrolase [Chloroflexota bacterium]TMG22362.1 MAG: MBL fold metallo-hydrolase [Chloroflexota bacterium]TMG65940.1 MAG: MBL fold metallo-hydrolase [Chloroflexota bacterium]